MKRLLLLSALLVLGMITRASHVPGGNIAYECVGPNQYLVTLTLFEDCGTAFETNANELIQISNDCGLTNPNGSLPNTIFQQEISQLCPASMGLSECNGGSLPGIYMHQWQGIITLPGPCDSWTFGYSSCCRNTTTNVTGQPGYYWEAVLNSQTEPCNTSPQITNPAVPYVCVGQAVCYNLGVVEPDGHTLVYSLIQGQSAAGTFIPYNGGFSGAVPIPGITIDPNTGQIDFTPGTQGNYVVVVLIEEYDANGNLVGSIIHDIQFEVINCNNTILDCNSSGQVANITGAVFQTGPNTLQMCEGASFCFDISYDDPDQQDSLTFTSNIAQVLPGAVVTSNYPNVAAGDYSAVDINICWTPPPGSSNLNTIFSITLNDNACPVSGQQTFVYNIDVVGSTNAGPDQTICLGAQQAQLQAINGTVFNWTSIAGDPIIVGTNFSCNPCDNPIATPTVTTTYVVTSNLSGNCVNTDTVTINVVPDFPYTISAMTSSTCLYDPIPMNVDITSGGAGFSYAWYDSNFLNDTTVNNPIANITSPGNYTYYVDITSPQGCVKTDSLSFTIVSAVSPVIDILTTADTVCNTSAMLDVWFDTTVMSSGIVDDFDTGFDPTMWNSVSNGQSGQVGCGTQTGSGDALYFDSSTGDRSATTVAFNAAPCTTIDFCLFIGNQGSTPAPCENADTNEDVELQYSTNGGATWITIQVFNQADWDAAGPYSNSWACFSIPIPAGAQTGSTQFRWIQPQYSACTGCDNWSLDDVNIQCASQSTYNFNWTGSNMSSNTIQDPTVSPIFGSWYYVTVTDNQNSCTAQDSIYIETCPPCDLPSFTFNHISCPGLNDGSITATALPGTDGPPFIFEWSDSLTGAIIQTGSINGMSDMLSNIGAGYYTLSITDTTGCMRDTTITLVEPDSIEITAMDTTICVDGTATLTATAIGGNGGPYVYDWTGIGQGTPTVNPTISTCYEVLVTDANGCISEADTMCVNLLDSLSGNIIAPIVSVCPNGTINLDATVIGGDGGPYSYVWTNNGNTVANTAAHTINPTLDSTAYCISITDGCETPAYTECVDVFVYPVPTVLISSDIQEACFPGNITFSNDSDPNLSGQCAWTFGDGGTSNDCNPSYSYANPGTYDVSLTITTPDGCVVDSTAQAYINIYDYPVAAFDFGPQPTTFFDPLIDFTDNSLDATYWQWTFGDPALGSSNEQNPSFEFSNQLPGEYLVTLLVENEHGCADSITQTVYIDGIFTMYVPNAFTPNGDGINDVFQAQGEGFDESNFSLMIFNRWGERVFETTDINEAWNGSVRGVEDNNKSDIYVWRIITKDKFTGEKHELRGHVTLLK